MRIKNTYPVKLDRRLFQICDARKVNFSSTTMAKAAATTPHVSLCPHLKKRLVVSQKMNETSRRRRRRRMTSIMFKFTSTDRARERERERKKERMNS